MLHLAVTYPQGQEIPFEMFTMNGEQIFLVKLLGFVHIPCLYIYIYRSILLVRTLAALEHSAL
jgi:hypothetical protein